MVVKDLDGYLKYKFRKDGYRFQSLFHLFTSICEIQDGFFGSMGGETVEPSILQFNIATTSEFGYFFCRWLKLRQLQLPELSESDIAIIHQPLIESFSVHRVSRALPKSPGNLPGFQLSKLSHAELLLEFPPSLALPRPKTRKRRYKKKLVLLVEETIGTSETLSREGVYLKPQEQDNTLHFVSEKFGPWSFPEDRVKYLNGISGLSTKYPVLLYVKVLSETERSCYLVCAHSLGLAQNLTEIFKHTVPEGHILLIQVPGHRNTFHGLVNLCSTLTTVQDYFQAYQLEF